MAAAGLELFIRKCSRPSGLTPEALKIRNSSGLTPFHILASNKAMTVDFLESVVLHYCPKIVKDVMDQGALRHTIKSEVSEDVQVFLFGCHPIIQAEFVDVAKAYLKTLQAYFKKLQDQDVPISLFALSSCRQNGWVEFASSDFSDCNDLLNHCKELISTCSAIRALRCSRTPKDFGDRTALDALRSPS